MGNLNLHKRNDNLSIMKKKKIFYLMLLMPVYIKLSNIVCGEPPLGKNV